MRWPRRWRPPPRSPPAPSPRTAAGASWRACPPAWSCGPCPPSPLRLTPLPPFHPICGSGSTRARVLPDRVQPEAATPSRCSRVADGPIGVAVAGGLLRVGALGLVAATRATHDEGQFLLVERPQGLRGEGQLLLAGHGSPQGLGVVPDWCVLRGTELAWVIRRFRFRLPSGSSRAGADFHRRLSPGGPGSFAQPLPPVAIVSPACRSRRSRRRDRGRGVILTSSASATARRQRWSAAAVTAM